MSIFSKRWLETLIGTASVAVVINCMSPIDHPFAHQMAQQAIPILLGCLFIGGIAFLTKRHGLMSVEFLSCIALCSFLKEAQNRNFAYACPVADVEIRVAHFSPQNAETQQKVLAELPTLKANLISIQMPSDSIYELAVKSQLETSHRFHKKLNYPNNKAILLFSTYPIQDLDTLFSEEAPSLAGSVWIDSIHGKMHFFTTHVADFSNTTSPLNAQEKLQKITDYLEQRSQEKPLLTWGNIQLTAWSPEVRQFKNNTSLNDSRLDIDWQPCNEHIFYSNHLQCIGFSTLLNGVGVLGVYQFRPAKPAKNNKAHTLSTASGTADITMF